MQTFSGSLVELGGLPDIASHNPPATTNPGSGTRISFGRAISLAAMRREGPDQTPVTSLAMTTMMATCMTPWLATT
jgi:hypothetical protein